MVREKNHNGLQCKPFYGKNFTPLLFSIYKGLRRKLLLNIKQLNEIINSLTYSENHGQ